MRFKKLDLNLLVALDVLLEQRSLTRAADHLRLTQSAVSHALASLREHLNDPLLVRDGNMMLLTPRAESLRGSVKDILNRISASLQNTGAKFEPGTSEVHFVVSMTELAQALLLSRLLKRVMADAPNITITVLLQLPGADLNLDTGEVHVAITQCTPTSSLILSRRIIEDDFVCAVAKGNKDIGTRLTVEDLSRCKHVLYTGARIFTNEPLDVALLEYGISRKIVVTVESFRALDYVLASTNLITLIPKSYCALLSNEAPLRFLDLPVKIPRLMGTMYWHRMKNDDPAHAWFREQIMASVGDLRS